MPKNIVQDIVPPKKSIRSVELPSRTSRGSLSKTEIPTVSEKSKPKIKIIKKPEASDLSSEQSAQDFTNRLAMSKPTPATTGSDIIDATQKNPKVSVFSPPPPVPPGSTSSYTYEYSDPKKSSKKWLYISVAILFFAVAFGVSALFKSAQITVTPRQETLPVHTTLVAVKNATANNLGFQVVTVTKDVQKTVDATGSTQVNTKATGTIIIYNNYSTAPQQLVATTRFQTAGGLIFHIVKAVTIPGKKTVAGQSVAGNVEATVVADVAGSQYNIGLSDFTVPGLQGGPKYAGIYGRSKTNMTGGFSGVQKIVAKDTLLAAETSLEASLHDTLSQAVTMQIPANFALYTQSVSYAFAPITQGQSGTSTAVLDKKGTVSALIFDKTALTTAVFAKIQSTLTPDLAKITNLDSLDFAYATGTSGASLGVNTNSVTFTLTGNANVVWTFDENKLKTDMLGLSKTQANMVIATYPAINEAWIVTRPFWNQNIPKDPQKVTIINTLDTTSATPIAK